MTRYQAEFLTADLRNIVLELLGGVDLTLGLCSTCSHGSPLFEMQNVHFSPHPGGELPMLFR